MTSFEVVVQVSLHVAFDSFITDTRLSEWFCQDAQVEARPAGRFYVYWNDPKFYAMGEYLELEANSSLRLQWSDLEGTNTRLEISFSSVQKGTRIALQSEKPLGELAEQVWTRGFEALQTTLEQGYRPEVFEDAFLGLLGLSVLNPENAILYTPHVEQGLFLQGILKGSSLDAAGFQHADVISKLNSQTMNTIGDFIALVAPLKVNDRLEVEFWRGAEQRHQVLQLQKRNLPIYPDSLEALATYREAAQGQAQTALADFAATLSEAEANFKIRPNTWSAAEVVAHLINSERDTLTQIAYLQVGNSVRSFTTSLNSRIQALVKRYPTLPALVQALQAAQDETCDLIRFSTPEYLERKFHVTRIQFASNITAAHIEQHLGQMKRSVAAARA